LKKGVINRLFSPIADGTVLPNAFRDHDPERAAGRAKTLRLCLKLHLRDFFEKKSLKNPQKTLKKGF